MAHCVEAFTNRKAHPMIDLYAIEGVRLVGKYLARAVADGSDAEARAGLSLASLYGGFCLGPVNTAGGHALGLSARHALACGAWRRQRADLSACAGLQHAVGSGKDGAVMDALGRRQVPEIRSVFDAAYSFCAELGIEMKLSGLGVPQSDLDAMADDAFAIRRLLDNNPRDLSRADILSIYEAAY
jgi:alcohol dehydrogenase